MSVREEAILRQLQSLLKKRSSTDRKMGNIWMIVPLLPVIVGIIVAASIARIIIQLVGAAGTLSQSEMARDLAVQIVALYGAAILSLFLVLVVGAFALYYMIERRNSHFRRQQQFLTVLARYLNAKAAPSSGENISNLQHGAEESTFEEPDRPSAVWAVLFIFVTPIVELLIAYFLTQDLRQHEERQQSIFQTLPAAMNEGNFPGLQLTLPRTHKRDALLYLILTIFTAGLFWVYWFYSLLRDYNEHFQDQASVEDRILSLMAPAQQTTTCPNCGSSLPEGVKFCANCGKPLQS